MSGMSPAFPGLWDGMDTGIKHSAVGCSGYVPTIPQDGMRRTVGFRHSAVGRSGCVQDVPSIPGTLGWEGQWDIGTLQWDTRDMSGISSAITGLWDGKNTRI